MRANVLEPRSNIGLNDTSSRLEIGGWLVLVEFRKNIILGKEMGKILSVTFSTVSFSGAASSHSWGRLLAPP